MAPAHHRRGAWHFFGWFQRAGPCQDLIEVRRGGGWRGFPREDAAGSGFHTVLSLWLSVCESHVKVSCFVRPVSAAATFTAAAVSRQESQTTGRTSSLQWVPWLCEQSARDCNLGPSVGGDFPSFASYQIECKQYANEGVPSKPSRWVRCVEALTLCLPENAQPAHPQGEPWPQAGQFSPRPGNLLGHCWGLYPGHLYFSTPRGASQSFTDGWGGKSNLTNKKRSATSVASARGWAHACWTGPGQPRGQAVCTSKAWET